jgi:hypothetical protein
VKKKLITSILCMAALTLFMTGSALGDPISLTGGAVPGAYIVFNGNSTFNFTPGSENNQFYVNLASSTGYGYITSSGFTIGAVTGTTTQTALVTGTGTLVITDPTGTFQGNIQWVNIATTGTGSTLNLLGTANITGPITYSGTDPLLLAFSQQPFQSGSVTFSFNPAVTLTELTTSIHQTTFQNSFSAVPIPGTAMLLGSGLAGLMALGWRRRRKS